MPHRKGIVRDEDLGISNRYKNSRTAALRRAHSRAGRAAISGASGGRIAQTAERGRAHGSLTPDSIVLTASGLEILPAASGNLRVTPYTAPEVASGRTAANARSDLFSFGAVVFEILTGRKAFEGDSESAIMASLFDFRPAWSGSPAVDRFLTGCLVRATMRWQRIEKVQLELKLLTEPARPSGASRVEAPDADLRAEFARFEARVTAGLKRRSKQSPIFSALPAKPSIPCVGNSPLCGRNWPPHRKRSAKAAIQPSQPVAGERIALRLQRSIDHLNERLALLEQNPGTPSESLLRFETGLESLREQLSDLHTHVAADMRGSSS